MDDHEAIGRIALRSGFCSHYFTKVPDGREIIVFPLGEVTVYGFIDTSNPNTRAGAEFNAMTEWYYGICVPTVRLLYKLAKYI